MGTLPRLLVKPKLFLFGSVKTSHAFAPGTSTEKSLSAFGSTLVHGAALRVAPEPSEQQIKYQFAGRCLSQRSLNRAI
jgi:hypothetical protein